MKVRQVSSSPVTAKTDLLTVPIVGDPARNPVFAALDAKLGRRLRARVKAERFAGKPGEILVVYTAGKLNADHVALAGAGKADQFKPSALRDIAAEAVKRGRKLGAKSILFALPEVAANAAGARFAAAGAYLGAYRFERYRTANNKRNNAPREFAITAEAPTRGGRPKRGNSEAARELGRTVRRTEAVTAAVCRARDLINEPAGVMTPTKMAAEARELAKSRGLTVKVLHRRDCEKLGMGLFLGVAQGSAEEPQLIHLSYKPKQKPERRIALVGKGVTFDSGGYSLKPTAGMLDMKADMSGAAAVISAMGMLEAIDCPHEVHAFAACAENMVSDRAYRLGDVLRCMDGTTVEINNTDAEGRLTLGDAISYAKKTVEPDELIDFATLTGACVVALGPYTAGVMSNDDAVAERWMAAAAAAGEDMWRLPLTDRLAEQLKSPIADMRNTGERWGGAITAGLFLKHFVKDTPWVHVDIAGPAMSSREQGSIPQGGTGFAVATLAEYLAG